VLGRGGICDNVPGVAWPQADFHHEDTKSTKKKIDGGSREAHSLAFFALFVSSW
jgi:hypothetical protein